jgi:hypothetical protein
MSNAVFFDHIEVHVDDIPRYCEFLLKIFQGGRYQVITDSGISMFASNVGINIEVKQRAKGLPATASGFCNPCLRMEDAKAFIEEVLGFTIERTISSEDGNCHFFTDHEGIAWHVKDYLRKDRYTNW